MVQPTEDHNPAESDAVLDLLVFEEVETSSLTTRSATQHSTFSVILFLFLFSAQRTRI